MEQMLPELLQRSRRCCRDEGSGERDKGPGLLQLTWQRARRAEPGGQPQAVDVGSAESVVCVGAVNAVKAKQESGAQ